MTRHRFDPFSFVVGGLALAFAALVIVRPGQLELLQLRLAGPVVLLTLGIAALASATGRTSDRATTDADDPGATSTTEDQVDMMTKSVIMSPGEGEGAPPSRATKGEDTT